MPKEVRLRRGTTAQHATFTGADGEVTFDTDKKCLVVHDGVTAGGRPLAGFVLLDTGVEGSYQALQNGLQIVGADGDDRSLYVVGSAEFASNLYCTSTIVAGAFANQLGPLTYSASVQLRMDQYGFKTLDLTGDVTFTVSPKVVGGRLAVLVRAGAAQRALSFPAGMKFVGAAAPTSLAANKCGLLQLLCFGALDSEVVARWLAEP